MHFLFAELTNIWISEVLNSGFIVLQITEILFFEILVYYFSYFRIFFKYCVRVEVQIWKGDEGKQMLVAGIIIIRFLALTH